MLLPCVSATNVPCSMLGPGWCRSLESCRRSVRVSRNVRVSTYRPRLPISLRVASWGTFAPGDRRPTVNPD